MTKVAAALRCPHELLMLLNGIVDPAAIHVGQTLVYVPMRLRVEINLPRREITVWDAETLVASYNVTDDLKPSGQAPAVEDATVSQRDGYVDGAKVPAKSPHGLRQSSPLPFQRNHPHGGVFFRRRLLAHGSGGFERAGSACQHRCPRPYCAPGCRYSGSSARPIIVPAPAHSSLRCIAKKAFRPMPF